MPPLALLPDSIVVDRIALDRAFVTLFLHTTAATAVCLACGEESAHVHCRYVRRLHDLPVQGRQALLELTVVEATASTQPAAPQPEPTAKQRRLDQYMEVRRRQQHGESLRQIAREMRLAWRVVRRYVESDHCPDWRAGHSRSSTASGCGDRVDAWLAQGHRNVAEFHRQLQAEKPALRYDALRRLVNQRLAVLGEQRQRANAAKPALSPAPSPREVSFAVLIKVQERS